MTVLVKYVAPARWLLDELHRPDPDWPAGTELGEETAGRTRCGLPMLASDLWQRGRKAMQCLPEVPIAIPVAASEASSGLPTMQTGHPET